MVGTRAVKGASIQDRYVPVQKCSLHDIKRADSYKRTVSFFAFGRLIDRDLRLSSWRAHKKLARSRAGAEYCSALTIPLAI